MFDLDVLIRLVILHKILFSTQILRNSSRASTASSNLTKIALNQFNA